MSSGEASSRALAVNGCANVPYDRLRPGCQSSDAALAPLPGQRAAWAVLIAGVVEIHAVISRGRTLEASMTSSQREMNDWPE